MRNPADYPVGTITDTETGPAVVGIDTRPARDLDETRFASRMRLKRRPPMDVTATSDTVMTPYLTGGTGMPDRGTTISIAGTVIRSSR